MGGLAQSGGVGSESCSSFEIRVNSTVTLKGPDAPSLSFFLQILFLFCVEFYCCVTVGSLSKSTDLELLHLLN